MKKILVILPTFGAGGAETVALHLMNFWVSEGYSVSLATTVKSNHILLHRLNKEIVVHHINAERLIKSLVPLRSLVLSTKPDVVWAGIWPLTCIVCMALLGINNKPRLVITEHVDHSDDAAKPSLLYNCALRASIIGTYFLADSVIAVSNGVKKSLVTLAPYLKNKVLVLPNATVLPDINEVKAKRVSKQENKNQADIIKFISIGTLKKQKNHVLLLDSFQLVLKQINARLIIIGDGPLAQELISYSAHLNISQNVSFQGHRDNISDYLYDADVFVLSSDWEGLGMVLIEALAHGCQIVSTDCKSGPREILLDGQLGALVPTKDKFALANAMINSSSLDVPAEVMREAIKEYNVLYSGKRHLEVFFPNFFP